MSMSLSWSLNLYFYTLGPLLLIIHTTQSSSCNTINTMVRAKMRNYFIISTWSSDKKFTLMMFVRVGINVEFEIIGGIKLVSMVPMD